MMLNTAKQDKENLGKQLNRIINQGMGQKPVEADSIAGKLVDAASVERAQGGSSKDVGATMRRAFRKLELMREMQERS